MFNWLGDGATNFWPTWHQFNDWNHKVSAMGLGCVKSYLLVIGSIGPALPSPPFPLEAFANGVFQIAPGGPCPMAAIGLQMGLLAPRPNDIVLATGAGARDLFLKTCMHFNWNVSPRLTNEQQRDINTWITETWNHTGTTPDAPNEDHFQFKSWRDYDDDNHTTVPPN